MKGNRPNAIPDQIQGSVAAHIDVIGSEEVCAKVSSQRDRHHKTDNSEMSLVAHGVCSGLTTQAQRPGARDATMATTTLPPGSLQRMVRPLCAQVSAS